jgi:hypothetical protein
MKELRPSHRERDIHEIRAIATGAAIAVLMVPLLTFEGPHTWGITGWSLLVFVLFGAGGAGALAAVGITLGLRQSARAANVLYNPTGSTTPYERVFSYQHALEMRGDIAGAAESWEALIKESPGDPAVRFAAAALFAGRGNDPARAAELYREIRQLPGATMQHEFGATNALIDLYRGPLKDEGRERSELRRFAERFAGTPQGEMARRALEEARAAADGGST